MLRTLSFATGTLLAVVAFSITDAQAASKISKAITAAVADRPVQRPIASATSTASLRRALPLPA